MYNTIAVCIGTVEEKGQSTCPHEVHNLGEDTNNQLGQEDSKCCYRGGTEN